MGLPIKTDGSTLIQSVDWTKRSAQEWLDQYGLWVNSCHDHSGRVSSDSALAAWTSNESDRRKRDHRMNQFGLAMSDDEARAVMHLLIDLKAAEPQVGAIVVMRVEQQLSYRVISARFCGSLSHQDVGRRYHDGLCYLTDRMGLGEDQ